MLPVSRSPFPFVCQALRSTVLIGAVYGSLGASCGGGQPRTNAAPAQVQNSAHAAPTALASSAGKGGVDAAPSDGASRSPEASVAPSVAPPTGRAVADPSEVAGTMVLHFGDSFAGALGMDLKKELERIGVKNQLRFRKSSYIPDWAWREPIDDYLRKYEPDLVLINVGANELEIADPSMRIKTIQKLVARVGERPCVWIGVPLWEGARTGLPEVIRSNCAPCIYMDTAALIPDMDRARDDIHPSMNARVAWAKLVVHWLLEQRVGGRDEPWALRRQ